MEECPNPGRYKKKYLLDQKVGNRIIIRYEGLKRHDVSVPDSRFGKWEHHWLVRCTLCGHIEVAGQHKISAFYRAYCCAYCPPDVKRKRRPRKKHRPNVLNGVIHLKRPTDQEALWHLWVHKWMPPVSLRFCDGMRGFDSLRARYLRSRRTNI